ncbi:MAG: outer membrane lipoprotein carrier protein LolA [Desulfovibrio sp.]|jgi:outer membrane lipoprotein carrier protein|nr:outer membrane lipoprotein carrier protein LolA [Desulfovibrio sp.]
MQRFLIFLLAIFLFPLPKVEGKTPPDAEKLQGTYSRLTSLRADFSQILLHKESGAREERKGLLLFRKPLLVRWETKDPSPELLVVTASEIWNVFPLEEIAFKYSLNLARDARSIIRVVTGQSRLDQDFNVKEEGQEEGLSLLRLFPKEPTQSLVEALLWVDTGTGLIRRLRVYDFYLNENEIRFSSQEINVSLPDGAFAYTPDKGFAVEDRTGADNAGQTPLLR